RVQLADDLLRHWISDDIQDFLRRPKPGHRFHGQLTDGPDAGAYHDERQFPPARTGTHVSGSRKRTQLQTGPESVQRISSFSPQPLEQGLRLAHSWRGPGERKPGWRPRGITGLPNRPHTDEEHHGCRAALYGERHW